MSVGILHRSPFASVDVAAEIPGGLRSVIKEELERPVAGERPELLFWGRSARRLSTTSSGFERWSTSQSAREPRGAVERLMVMKRALAAIATIAVIAAGCGSSDDGMTTSSNTASIRITGEVAYADGSEQTAESTLTITLADTSLQDVSYVVIGEMTIDLAAGGQLPVAFELDADTSGADTRGMFSLLASVNAPDGDLLWTTDTDYSIDIAQTDVDFGTLTLVAALG